MSASSVTGIGSGLSNEEARDILVSLQNQILQINEDIEALQASIESGGGWDGGDGQCCSHTMAKNLSRRMSIAKEKICLH